MRLMECLRLRVKDVDFARNEITIRGGKGAKDWLTVLPKSLVDPLQREIERERMLRASGSGGVVAACASFRMLFSSGWRSTNRTGCRPR